MQHSDAIERLQRQIDRLRKLSSPDNSEPTFLKWKRDTGIAIRNIFGADSRNIKEFQSIMMAYGDRRKHAEAIIQSMIDELKEYPKHDAKHNLSINYIELKTDRILRICQRFHTIATQLRHRYNNRETLNVKDEYDVQDLLHALLKLEFDDVRPEEWTPSYAGKSSRMDFLLKQQQIVVETKKTRNGLGQKEIGDELIIDIARYKSHPECKLLFCFVYDPENHISNPAAIENDLSGENNGVKIQVLVHPKGA